MIFKVRLGRWRFTFSIAPVVNVTGVNSTLEDGNHIIMWDFDDTPLESVELALASVECYYELPNIYILSTGKPNHYIAYCFKRCPWQTSVEIVAATPLVCPNFFKYGVYREKWTLRVTPKEGRKPKLVKILPSNIPETANISELNSWVKDTKAAPKQFLSPFLQLLSYTFPHDTYPPKIRDTRRPSGNENEGVELWYTHPTRK